MKRVHGLCWLLLVGGLWTASVAAVAAEDRSSEERILPMEVVVNGVKSGTWLMVERSGVLYAPRDAFDEWRVTLQPQAPRIVFKGLEYFSVSSVSGFTARMDFANQSMDLSFSADAFAATRLGATAASRPVPSPVLPSVFFNYDFNYTKSNPRLLPDTEDFGMLGELGFSNGWGVFTQTFVGRNLTDDPANTTENGWTRLETTFTRDFLDAGRTLRLGDSSTRASMWGRRVYYGGVQYGTNFSLTPGFISQPLPVVTGLSTAPSTVELYVNGVLNKTGNVPPGPFVVDNFPQMTGSGEAKLVVRDLLGRENVVTLPFFVSSQLLKADLNDWSVEAGSLRNNLGIEDSNYGPGFLSGTWRHGYSDEWTLEGRAEATATLSVLGGGTVFRLPWQMLGKVGAAASDEDSLGGGHFWLFGLEHQALRFGAMLETQGASREFRQLGQDVAVAPIRRQLAGNAYYGSPNAMTFGMGVAAFERYDDTRLTTVSANFSTRTAGRGSFTALATRAVDGGSGKSVGVIYSQPLDGGRFVSATANRRDGKDDFYLTATQNIDADHNLGWRVMTGKLQDQSHSEGGLYYLGRYGRVSGEVSATESQDTARLGASGGLVVADGRFFATRRVDQSFAVAEVAGYGDVGIGLNTNMMTRTDSSGAALIPNLSPYQANSIRVNPQELPINAQIESIEETAVPGWRSAVKVSFPVRSGRGALIKIVLDDGKLPPAGAVVQIEGDKEEFYVARRGEAFVTGLQTTNAMTMTWGDGQRCRFAVTLPGDVAEEFPRVGPIACRSAAP